MRTNKMVMQGLMAGVVSLGLMGSASRAEAATWHPFTGSGQPSSWEPSSVPIGGTSVLAIEYDGTDYKLQLLGQGVSGSDHHLSSASCSSLTTCTWTTTGTVYRTGVSYSETPSDSINLFAWTASGALYKNGTHVNSGADDPALLGAFTMDQSSSDVEFSGWDVALDATQNCSYSGDPSGRCIYGEGEDVTWAQLFNGGVAQLSQPASFGDRVSSLLAVDNSGGLWGLSQTTTSATWSTQTGALCGGGTLTFGEITSNVLVYALAATDSGGSDVYVFNILSGCWQEAATPPSGLGSDWAYSLTSPVTSSFSDSNGIAWATDANGDVWYVN